MKKIAYLIVSFLVVVGVGAHAINTNTIQLVGDLPKPTVLRSSGSIDSFVSATLSQGGTVLDLKFLDAANNLTIEVYGNDGSVVFSETKNVVNGTRIIADLTVSSAWAFEVYIYDDKGAFIMGFFELP